MGKDCISKLYVGQLPTDVKEETLRNWLIQGGLSIRNVFSLTLKKGYGFIECGDQATADLVIDRFHGASFCGGKAVLIEPATSHFVGANSKNTRVIISPMIPTDVVSTEDVDRLVENWGGNLLSMEKMNANTYVVTVADITRANQLVDDCNGLSVNGCPMKVELATAEHDGNSFEDQRGSRRSRSSTTTNTNSNDRLTEFPLRMLIPSEHVGALIGRGGQTIRSITHTTGARVDVIRSSSGPGSPEQEKVITILGSPESTSAACKRVLEIIAEESSANKNKTADVCLRILANNSLIGRVIGKGGANIVQMMRDTQTKIHISNQMEVVYPVGQHSGPVTDGDRVITIRGSIDGMCMAEDLVSAKLKNAYENDLQAVRGGFTSTPPAFFSENPHSPVRHGFGQSVHSQSMMSPMQSGSYDSPSYPSYYYQTRPSQPHKSSALFKSMNGFETETTYLYMPKKAVGAVIGTRGSTIRSFIRGCGASIKISNADIPGTEERKVSINGPLEGHWKAQWLLCQKLNEVIPGENLKTKIELIVPTNIVGRLIGKEGARIKEIQQHSGARIKFIQRADEGENNTVLQICGTYHQLYTAQARIRDSRITIKTQMEREAYYAGNNDEAQYVRRRERGPPKSSNSSPSFRTED